MIKKFKKQIIAEKRSTIKTEILRSLSSNQAVKFP